MHSWKKYQFEIILIIVAFAFYYLFVGADYYTSFVEGRSWSLDADSRKTILFLQTGYFEDNPLISLGSNFLGPSIILGVFRYSNFLVFLFNLTAILLCCHLTFRHYDIRRNLFFFWLFINPLVFFSLFTVNKEIPALAWILMIACYFKSKNFWYFLLIILFAILARYQLIMLSLIFFIIDFLQAKLRLGRPLLILGIVLGLSVILPFFRNVEVISLDTDGQWESAAENKFGLLSVLTALQNNYYLFFLVFIPKLVFNLVGPLYKVFFNTDLVVKTFFSNFYNIFITTIGAFFFDLLILKLIWMKRVSIKQNEIYFAIITMIIYMANPILQVRYLLPAYALGVIALSRKNFQKNLYAS